MNSKIIFILFSLFFIFNSAAEGCLKQDSKTGKCLSCVKGYLLNKNQCMSCFPCKTCELNANKIICKQCQQPYLKHPNGNCYICDERKLVNGNETCLNWVVPDEYNKVNNILTIILIVFVSICLAYGLTKLYNRYQSNNRSPLRASSVKKLIPKSQQKSQDFESSTKSGSFIQQPKQLIQQKSSLQVQIIQPELGQLCYYCKQLNTNCQTQCLIQSHIQCQIQQFKNLNKCFRCKSEQFHTFGKCQGCKQFKIKLNICDDNCQKQDHINCYALLNYEQYCEKCQGQAQEQQKQKTQ